MTLKSIGAEDLGTVIMLIIIGSLVQPIPALLQELWTIVDLAVSLTMGHTLGLAFIFGVAYCPGLSKKWCENIESNMADVFMFFMPYTYIGIGVPKD